jgi:predicted naringenin-chalcone synthase
MVSMPVVISSIGLATPALYVTQEEAYASLIEHFSMGESEKALYRRVLLGSDAIDGRYIGMDEKSEVANLDQDQLIERFARHGRKIAAEASRNAISQAKIEVETITGLIVNTCTGYLCPGMTSHLVEDLGLSARVKIRDLVGMGCGGALPNLDTAVGMISRSPQDIVLCVSYEICTATLFMGPDPDLVISNCIFADGAGASVLRFKDDQEGLPEEMHYLEFATGIYPEYRKDLHYRTEQHRLRNVLSRRVPVIAAEKAEEVLNRLLVRNKLGRNDIDHWVMHPGGTQVLEKVQQRLELPPNAFWASHEIFRRYGNMSSPSVLFILREIIDIKQPKSGEKAVLLAFGAGFSVFATLIEF